MATKILNDIHTDLKLLITTLTGFEEDEEGFSICERFVLSNVRHHRFLSVNAHVTSRRLDELEDKFLVHGKYEVARKFRELVSIFLGSFDFKSHPQHDLQWSLLTLLLDLSGETDKVDLRDPGHSKYIPSSSSEKTVLRSDADSTETIDWARYLTEDQPEFFRDYGNEDESEWSEDDDDNEIPSTTTTTTLKASKSDTLDSSRGKEIGTSFLEKISRCREEKAHAESWLAENIQNVWWNELEWHRCRVESDFEDAKLCDIWQSTAKDFSKVTVTLSEYRVCRELLWMFHSPTRMLVFEYQNGEFLVRPNLSIPSLTMTGFQETLRPFCRYFSMIKEIEDFGRELHSRDGACSAATSQLPPLTYETYFAAITRKILEFRRELLQLEIRMLKQDDITSFLTLSKELKGSLDSLEMIYELHLSVVSDWKVSPNWKCASRLLSSLYFEMRNSSNLERTHFAASLYLSSLSVYLNIIDTWLTEGLLEDYRDEFIVAKRSNNEVSEVEDEEDDEEGKHQQQSDKFIVRPLDRICSRDPIMQLLLHKIQYMGRSIEILVSLDRISDMWKTLPDKENTDSRVSLNDELHANLQLEFAKYANPSLREDQTDGVAPPTSPPSVESYDPDLEGNIMRQISRSPNPFLLKAFERYLPSLEFCKKVDVPDTDGDFHDSISSSKVRSLPESLEKSKATLPLRKILETSLSAILDRRYSSASVLVKTILVNEYKLEAHLKLMRCVYTMERGHIMKKFYQTLFLEIESNPIWNNSYFLMCILEEVLSQEWPDSSSHWSISVPEVPTHRVLEAIDQLTLHYAIGWPINMVLNEESLVKYNEIFRFQLKLKWALWTLNNLQFSDLEGSKTSTGGGEDLDEIQHFQIRRLETLRFWLLHAIGSIHSYLCGQVLQSLGLIFEKALRNAENLGGIVTVHDKYLDTVHEHCLLTSEYEDLLATISNLLEMCVHVRERWKRGKVVFAPTELSLMESNYIKYHTYLALALRNAVEHKDADYYELTPPHFHMNIEEDEDIAYVKAKHDIINERMSDLSRNLLSEIAYQTLPPSGIPLPIPVLVRKRRKSWQGLNFELRLEDQISLSEYQQTFSYLRWYRYEEYTERLNSSTVCFELNDFIEKHRNE